MTAGRTVNIDLYSDLISFARSELRRAGYANTHKPCSRDILRIYFVVRKRLIAPRPRSIHRAKEFSCPTKFLTPLAVIEGLIQNGGDITPYMSEKIKKLRYDDSLLNDWGIHHLHLGKNIRRNGFVCRTGMLLFCRFEKDDAYLIDILPHKRWADQGLAATIHENWPELLRRFRLNGIIGAPVSNTEISELRRKNYNPCLVMSDGTVYAPPGGGVTLNGTNSHSVSTASTVCDLLHWEQEMIVDNIREITRQASEKGIRLPDPAKFSLILQDGFFCAVEHSSGVAIRLKKLSRYILG